MGLPMLIAHIINSGNSSRGFTVCSGFLAFHYWWCQQCREVQCHGVSPNTSRSESWVQPLGRQLLSASSANLWARVVWLWLGCHIPAPAPQSLLVSVSLHKHRKMTRFFIAVPTSSSSSSQTTTMLKPTTEEAKRGCFQGWQRAFCCDCWSMLTFTTFFPLLFCYIWSIQSSQCPWKVIACTSRCVACVCCAPLQLPCIGEYKRFWQICVYTDCASATSHIPFSCIDSTNSQNSFPLLFQLSFLVYFSSPIPCKRQLHMNEAKGAQYMSEI